MANTGYLGYTKLEQYNLDTGIATGFTKPNIAGDPDYVAPTYNPLSCPLPVQQIDNPIEIETFVDTVGATLEITANTTYAVNSDLSFVIRAVNMRTGFFNYGYLDIYQGTTSGHSVTYLSDVYPGDIFENTLDSGPTPAQDSIYKYIVTIFH